MKKLYSLTTLIIISLTFSLTAHSTLVENGSFESFDITESEKSQSNPNASWWYFLGGVGVDGWTAGPSVEIWNGSNNPSGPNVFNAYDGEYHAELNSHPSPGNAFNLYQTLDTVTGQTYEFSFAHAGRAQNPDVADTMSFSVFGNFGAQIHHSVYTAEDNYQWTVYSGTFTANSDTSTIMFTSIVPQTQTLGNFIDDVKVTSVSEPAALGLLALSMLAFGFSRRK